jgi:L-fuculose-phosphate aldolase
MHPRAESIPLILDVCRRLAARGFVAATDGNVSVRLADGNILTTRSGVSKGAMAERDLVEVTPEGIRRSGEGKPSTELGMHLAIYRARSDINAVVHAHPVYATGFAAARLALDAPVFPEVVAVFGGIPLAPYATPSTGEVEASIAPFLKTHEAILLSNHGAVTYAASLE